MRWCIHVARDTILWEACVNICNKSSGYVRGKYLSLCRESKSDGPAGNLVTTQTELPRAYRINSTLIFCVGPVAQSV